jgi:flagellar hook-associated protein 2
MSSTVSTYTPITKSGQITYAGLGNGTDFTALIKKLVQVEQTRVTSLQTWKKSWTQKQTAFNELNTQMLTLKSTLNSMSSMDTFLSKKVDASDSTVLSAVASAGADNGTHSLIINRLATSKAMVGTTGYTSPTTDINPTSSDAVFAYAYKGVTYSNAVGTNSTLTDLANVINNNPSNPGVKASVSYDGSKYYMQLRGMDTGSSASLVINDTSTTLPGFSSADFSTITSNASAQIKLDGWPATSGSWIIRESNSVKDLIPGISLTLKNTGSAVVTTTTDTQGIKEKVESFVEQINLVRTKIKAITKFDSTTKQASLLTGNYGVQLIDTNLKNAVAGIGVGFDYDADRYSTLSQLGILTDAEQGSATEGLLVINDDVFNAILASNADAVGQLFAAQYVGRTTSSDFSISSYIKGTTKCGTYQLSYTTDASGKLTDATINGHAATFHSNSNLITGKFGYGEAGMVIRVVDVTAGTHTGEVALKQGKAGQISTLLDQLTDEANGPLHILDKNYTDITKMIDQKIASEQRRVSTFAAHLRKRFAKVDSLLGTYDKIQNQLASQIKQLTGSSTK